MEKLIAYLREHGVVELEDGKLCGLCPRVESGVGHFRRTIFRPYTSHVLRFELLEDDFCPINDTLWHARHLSYVDTERVLRPTGKEFAQEDHFLIHLSDGHVVVADAWEEGRHVVEFVVVGCKEHLGMGTVFVDILYNRPCDGDTIVGRGAATEFIEEHERALAEVVEDSRCFVNDRVGVNTSVNLAHPAGKVIAAALVLLILSLPLTLIFLDGLLERVEGGVLLASYIGYIAYTLI